MSAQGESNYLLRVTWITRFGLSGEVKGHNSDSSQQHACTRGVKLCLTSELNYQVRTKSGGDRTQVRQLTAACPRAGHEKWRCNITKCCACHEKWLSWLILLTFKTSLTMRGAKALTLQRLQILCLPCKMTRMIDSRHIRNVIYTARSNRQHTPTSPNTASCHAKLCSQI